MTKEPAKRALSICATWLVTARPVTDVPRATFQCGTTTNFARAGIPYRLHYGDRGRLRLIYRRPETAVPPNRVPTTSSVPPRHLSDQLDGRVYGPYRPQSKHYYTCLLRSSALRVSIPILRA